jgi:iron complex transport system permease protein
MGGRLGIRAGACAALLVALWALCLLGALCSGHARGFSPAQALRGLFAALDLADPLPGNEQIIAELRLLRALSGLGVGAALGLSGAYLQGLFRNPLASPGVLGVSAGAGLGASLAIALLGGFGPGLVLESAGLAAPLLVTLAALLGGLGVLVLLIALASTGGRLSVPALLLTGMALNALCAGFLAALQSLTLGHFEMARAMFAWAFGTLDDRSGLQVGLVWAALGASLLAIPFLATELDLLAGGEEDAAALGVDVARVRLVALLCAALAASAAVSVAGQIGFVGLLVPHMVRRLAGERQRVVLALSALGGGALLLGSDVLQRLWLPAVDLRPGVVMSLLGAPFFLYLLAREPRAWRTW